MANIKFSRKEFEKQIKLTKEIEDKIPMFGTPLESLDDNEVELEIFPNRPDLLSMHGFIRGFSAFLGKKTGLCKYKINKPEKDFQVTIDKSTLEIRPFTACAIIKGLNFNDEKIKEVIDIQEKLHGTLGRNRKKIAIGIYPLDKIKLPIKLEARKPNDIKFVPLEAHAEMTGRQILTSHPTGREYGKLLQKYSEYPVFVDANNEILSMPPIINSHKTGRITNETKDIFIECSGFDLNILKKTLNILSTMFADMGGKIYQMNIKHKKENYVTPDLTPQKTKLNIENCNKLLGLNLKEKEIEKLLEKMGHDYRKKEVESPAWRTDILHENDIIEDIAIAYGYEKIIPEIPNISSIGQENSKEIYKRKIAEILQGLNMLEISNYHLTTIRDQFKIANIPKKNYIEVEDSKTEYNILRKNLIHYALKILKENSDSEYPQKIFELGKIFEPNPDKDTGIEEQERLCIAIADAKTDFTEIKQALDYLMRMLGKEYSLEPAESPYYIDGRCGKIIVNNKEIGYIGEIHPRILNNIKVKMPITALELNVDMLLE